MHKRYEKYFGETPLYLPLLTMFGIDHIVSESDDSVCLTFVKGNWHSSRTFSILMLDALDDDTLSYALEVELVNMVAELSEGILSETKLQKN
ncbi:hypothetical protein Lw1_gp055 [Escherichia phage Lw1]|uniref:Uncharacterized protein n=1 Tax=Escherichia phage Lw1 TaxID=1307804 RepID=M9V113_9CAUD|nr:hypothetical protein Lw1_gp055 [Escherichia phage Lw1]AGJ71464.1 hypothetical protein Lw1_gp055 [Escherichia phage Lw1]